MNKEELSREMLKHGEYLQQVASEIKTLLEEKMTDDLELQLMTIDFIKHALETAIQLRDYSYMQLEEE